MKLVLIFGLFSFSVHAELVTQDFNGKPIGERTPTSVTSGSQLTPEQQAEMMKELDKYKSYQLDAQKLLKEIENNE